MKGMLRFPLIVSALAPCLLAVAWAQSDAPSGDSKAADKAEARPGKQRARARGRLPAFYNQVIDGQQREKIYAIQQQYEPKIAALKAELQALQDKVDAECDAVLTAEQREKVKSLSEAAQQKRKNAAGARAAAPATTEASTPDAGAAKPEAAKADADAKPGK